MATRRDIELSTVLKISNAQRELKCLTEKKSIAFVKALQGENQLLRKKDKAREKEIQGLLEENQRLKSASTEKWEGVEDEKSTGETSWDPPMMTNPRRK